MAQMGATLAAYRFDTHHAVAGVSVLRDRLFTGGGMKAGPSAARVKLGDSIKQLGIAANAVVAATFPMVFVFASEGPFCGGFAGHLIGHGLGIFSGK
jgi:hypothetical protein